MAFQQPTRQPLQRVARPVVTDAHSSPQALQDSSQHGLVDESQTWVLFSPATDVTTASYLSETEHSIETAGRSQLSDLGSRLSASQHDEALSSSRAPEVLSAVEAESIEDDAELDSLDSHLPEFRSRPNIFQTLSHRDNHHSAPVLPTHDGLGSFRLDQPALGREAQDQIYQFERFNPRRVRRRLSSTEQSQVEQEQEYGQAQAAEKREWIEAWRLEHSRMLLDEVQRETRRRQKSRASQSRSHQHGDVDSDKLAWHDEDAVQDAAETESVVARITRKVVKDFLGIDDRLLSILLGESLPDEGDLSATPRASLVNEHRHAQTSGAEESSWQLHIVERVSRELGMLVHGLSEHPGAFSTYSRIQHMTLPYAGLPVIPESGIVATSTADPIVTRQPSQPSLPEFKPTIHQQTPPMDIPGRVSDFGDAARDDVDMGNTFTKDEWEKDLDIKLVFKYLLSRFTSRSTASSSVGSSHGAGSSQDPLVKAARVRQHHPLISRTRPTERRTFKATASNSPVALRPHSSCASQSTRRSARRSSCSSRHYWDIGGSLNTGSVIASHGPMGSWGEV